MFGFKKRKTTLYEIPDITITPELLREKKKAELRKEVRPIFKRLQK